MGAMRNVKLTIEYDGTGYVGWQVQPNGTSVQEVLQRAVAEITGEPDAAVVGSGRTDAGVHAAGQVAHIKTETAIPAGDLVHAINTKLPDDIAVLHAADVPPDFHARYAARAKTYRYSILNRPVRSPLARNRTHLVRHTLDVSAMRAAARHLVGRHDFTSFQSKPDGTSAVRTISRLEIQDRAPRIDIEVTANGFLYHMVRTLAGTLIEVGRGRRAPDDIPGLIEARDRSRAGPTAPPQGLCLLDVTYEAEDTP
jgi:tRNA pseudouridine38-40 synthase